MDKAVPAALADVVEPLREADVYTRLQAIRQRGLSNVVTGLPGFFFLWPMWLQVLVPPRGEPSGWAFLPMAGWALFILACFGPQLLLPLARRHRPDWQSPLLEASILKKALEKHFWFQFPFLLGYAALVPAAAAIVIALTLMEVSGAAWTLDAFAGALHVAAMMSLSWQSRKVRDPWLPHIYLGLLPLALAPWLDGSWFPTTPLLALLPLAVVAPLLGVGLVRLLAPRRWLVR